MCFWMATGSGKTLVLVKLIEVLRGLILAGEIPPNDVLVLTHRCNLACSYCYAGRGDAAGVMTIETATRAVANALRSLAPAL